MDNLGHVEMQSGPFVINDCMKRKKIGNKGYEGYFEFLRSASRV
jgi:hypothetical protein